MQCAVASDPSLPGFVKDPKFPKEFKKDTGQDLANFLTKNDSPTALMGSAMSNGFNPTQAGKLANALSEMERNVGASGTEVPSAIYASGGGGAGNGGGGEDPMAGMQDMMAGLMDQLNPNKKKEEQKSGVSAVIFANQTRSPASVAEDKKLSIFDRVTYRYYFVGKRIVTDEKENRR